MLSAQTKEINDVFSLSHKAAKMDFVAPFICRTPGRMARGHVPF